ncbi:hypothetical protein AVEN_43193-1 [Araneus ventricosus]|uniref:Uncharacterized protein n=1 Tax=Araneus ventricosus TaxID=182803 RepID=A0A4Y2F204_ARAVE|nr:hypothetical protein AVEN_43193-1 [Araneus ventricosus]
MPTCFNRYPAAAVSFRSPCCISDCNKTNATQRVMRHSFEIYHLLTYHIQTVQHLRAANIECTGDVREEHATTSSCRRFRCEKRWFGNDET